MDDLPTDRWQRLESLVHAALARPASERPAFLAGACGDDEALRREVESLVAGADSAGAFLETPAAGASLVGRQLGAYRLERLVGAGGMGEVYRAKDPRLGRDVAVKILPAAWAANPQRRSRFEREARAVAALNHPNICAIYDVGQEAGLDFLVMEYVDGEPLSAHLAHGPLPIDQALARAIEIAEALDAAHRQGIVHRDLKPGNVMVTRAQGTSRVTRAKLVDFGLARILTAAVGAESPPTATARMTATGAVLGTPQYMAPEQIEGRPADARTDVFAFGALLFEMLTGRPAFDGPSAPAIMAAILRAEPPSLAAAQPSLPRSLERLVHACLARDPADRVSSMHDVLLQLRNVTEEVRPPTRASAASGPARRGWRPAIVAVMALVIALAGAAIAWRFRPAAPILTDRDTILIADFANTTTDTLFDGALKQALAVSLEQSPFLSTLSQARIEDTLKLMVRPEDERVTRAIAQEICQRQNLKAFIAGTIAPVGSQYAISLEAVHGQTGDVLARELVQAATKEDVLAAVGTAAAKIRQRLGEPLASIQKYDVPLQMATTSSLEALRVYSMGLEHFQRSRYEEAVRAYTRATSLDPSFAKAWDSLAPAYGNLRRSGLAQDALRRAYDLRERASDRERRLIEARYQLTIERDLHAALEHYKAYLSIYTRSLSWWTTVGDLQLRLGRLEDAIAPSREALHRDSGQRQAPGNLARAFLALNQWSEAKSVLAAYPVTESNWIRAQFAIAYVESDRGRLRETLTLAAERSELLPVMLAWQSEAAGFEGRAGEALQLARRSEEAARQGPSDSPGALAESAVRYASFQDCASARAEAIQVLTASPNSAEAAMAMSWCGNADAADRVVAALRQLYPNGTLVQGLWIPIISAAASVDRDPKGALTLLDAVGPLKRSSFAQFRPQYLRGLAYLSAKQPADATAEFQWILDNRGLAPLSPLYALAHVGLARAAAMQGDQAKARREYEAFFSIWEHADPEVPILVAARKEYAALNQR